MKLKKINSKQIGFLSVIILVIGSTIGAGIFFKSKNVLANTDNSLLLSSVSWIIAAIGVIALALSLIEIASVRKDNLSFIGWCKTFCNRFVYKACKNFMFYAYVPLTFFFMPLYSIMSIQDSIEGFGGQNFFGTSNDWAIWMCLAIVIVLWFISFSGLSAKLGNIQGWIITLIKFIPLIVVAVSGFVILGLNKSNGGLNGIPINPVLPDNSLIGQDTFYELSPILGLFGSISAIFFAYDGFYTSAGIQTEMKKPKKTPIALVLGLSIVTIIYLIISLSMSLSSSGGSFANFKDFFQKHNLSVLYGFINLFIGIGIFGIINGYAMWAPRFIEDLIKSKELPFSNKFQKYLSPKSPKLGIIYLLIITIPVIIIFSTIGGLAYIPDGYLNSSNNSLYDSVGNFSTAKLYKFADLMGNWTAIAAFTFICFSIIGGLLNRRKKINNEKGKIKVVKFRFFVPFSIIAIIIVLFSLILEFISPFVNLILLINIKNNLQDEIIWRVTLVGVLFLFFSSMILPIFIEDLIIKKNKINPKQIYLDNWKKENNKI